MHRRDNPLLPRSHADMPQSPTRTRLAAGNSRKTFDQEADLWPIYIMVVEDESALRSLLADMLRESGFTVIEASNADEALRYCAQDADLDLVFTDVAMPGSMNGLGLAQKLRNDNPYLPLIIMSGNLGDRHVDHLGWFLPKPFRMEQAMALVFRLLGVKPR